MTTQNGSRMHNARLLFETLGHRILRNISEHIPTIRCAVGTDSSVIEAMKRKHGGNDIFCDWVCFGGFYNIDILDAHVGLLREEPAWTVGIHIIDDLWSALGPKLRLNIAWPDKIGKWPVYRYSGGVREHQLVEAVGGSGLERLESTSIKTVSESVREYCKVLQEVLREVK